VEHDRLPAYRPNNTMYCSVGCSGVAAAGSDNGRGLTIRDFLFPGPGNNSPFRRGIQHTSGAVLLIENRLVKEFYTLVPGRSMYLVLLVQEREIN